MAKLDSKQKKRLIISLAFIAIFLVIITWVIIDLMPSLYDLFKNKNDRMLRETIKEYGFYKYIVVGVLQMFQVILSVVPAEPVQFLAGITCDPIYGFIVCMVGVAFGNTFLFLGIRTFGFISRPNTIRNNDNDVNTIDQSNADKSIRAVTMTVLGMYFAPAIPYGIICYTAAKSKMSYLRYIIVTTLGTIPSVIMCLAASVLFLKSPIFLDDYLPLLIIGLFLAILVFLIIKYKKDILEHVLNRSIRATIIWLVPLIISVISLCYLFLTKKTHIFVKTTIFLFIFIIIYCISYFLFNRKFAQIFTRKKMEDFQREPKRPNPFVYTVLAFFIKIIFFTKYKVKVNKNGIKRLNTPSIILFNHPSKLDFIFSLIPICPQKVNVVTAYYYFCNYHLGRLLYNLGAFPKFLYQPDISAIKNIKKVLKREGIIAIAPEGRLSAYGAMESYIPSTAKLIKKEGVDVYMAKIEGSYLSNPKWAITSRTGRVDVQYKQVFTKEELVDMSIENIYNKLNDELNYDEFAWQEKNHIYFHGKKMIEGLEQILYICPVCGKEYTYSSKNDEMECSHCHTKVKLNHYYEFESENKLIPANIRDWYVMQKKIERKNIQNPEYKLESNVTLKHPDPNGLGFSVVGSGVATLTNKGVLYIGTINGMSVKKLFALDQMPAIPFGVREDFEIYHDGTLYYFIPENIRECVKWSVVEEQMYEDYIEKNNIKVWE